LDQPYRPDAMSLCTCKQNWYLQKTAISRQSTHWPKGV